jgi:hypothetical protein
MTSSDYALFISVASIFISIGALLWNVWQKFLFVKPAPQVSFGPYNILQPTSAGWAIPSGHALLSLTVTNMGPGPVVLTMCIVKPKAHWWTRATTYPSLNPIDGDPTDQQPTGIGPFGSGLPARIDAGEIKSFYFPYARGCCLRDGLARVGINDTYQRNTWCRRRDMRKANKAYRRDFG